MTKPKTVRLSKKGQFVIPKPIREALRVKEGDELIAMLEGERLVLVRPDQFARGTRGMLKGTWGRTKREIERYIEKERRSWK